MNIEIKLTDKAIEHKLSEDDGAYFIPKPCTDGSAAVDIMACIPAKIVIYPEAHKIIDTGICIHIDDPRYVAKIYPRSGLGSKGLVLGNLTGVIDSDYQGEIKVCLWNRGVIAGNQARKFTINPGERIAQMTLERVYPFHWDPVNEFSKETKRGAGGFGHSGVK